MAETNSNIRNTDGQFKERLEYILGFLALVLSLDGFNDELKNIKIQLIKFSFSLSQYFLAIILITILGLHFYFIPKFITGQKKFHSGLRKLLMGTTYGMMFSIAISPFVIGLMYLIGLIYNNIEVEFVKQVLKASYIVIIAGSAGMALQYALYRMTRFLKEKGVVDSGRNPFRKPSEATFNYTIASNPSPQNDDNQQTSTDHPK